MDVGNLLRSVFNASSLRANKALRMCMRRHGGDCVPVKNLLGMEEFAHISRDNLIAAIACSKHLQMSGDLVQVSAAHIEDNPPPIIDDTNYPPLSSYLPKTRKSGGHFAGGSKTTIKKSPPKRWADVHSEDSRSAPSSKC